MLKMSKNAMTELTKVVGLSGQKGKPPQVSQNERKHTHKLSIPLLCEILPLIKGKNALSIIEIISYLNFYKNETKKERGLYQRFWHRRGNA